MPAITAFGRKWLVGSDDFVFPAMLDLTVKLCWLLGALVVFFRNDPNFGCPDGDHFKIYLYGLLAMLLTLVLTDALVVRNSMCGSILDEEARVRVVPFIYIRCFFELLDIFWNILGTAWAYGDPFMMGCPEEPEALTFMKRFTVCNWISILIMFLFFVALWDPLGHYDDQQMSSCSKSVLKDPLTHPDYIPPYPSAYHLEPTSTSSSLPHGELSKYWTAKLKKLTCFCCNPTKDDTVLGAFEEAGRIVSYMFRDTNYVTTDVLGGLLALYVRTQNEEEARKEAIRKRNSISFGGGSIIHGDIPDGLGNNNGPVITCICHRSLPITTQPLKNTVESPEVLASKNEIVLLDHYLRFIHGCYGWKAFLVKNLKKRGIPRLWSSIQCCSCFRGGDGGDGILIKGDNCCLCSTAALRQTARVETKDIVYISFENGYFEPPFYVAVDHSTKSLIVAIRGTLTTRDMLTNLAAWPMPMEIPGLPLHFKCHHGMMITARNVKDKLEKDKVLERLFQKYPEYRLVLLGQSSGGAVATILGMMMYYEYPSLHVFCYSPPGCVLNRDAAEFSKSFVTSVTYGDDIVARLGIQSISRFKHKLNQAVASCQTPKYRLMLGYTRLFSLGRRGRLPKFEYFEQVPEVIVSGGGSVMGIDEDGSFSQQQQSHHHQEIFKDHASSVSGGGGAGVRTNFSSKNSNSHYEHSPFYTPMFVPGKILHVSQRDSWVEQPEAGPRWQLRWADKKEFEDIIISPRMIADHWYHRMEKGLHEFVIANCKEVFNALHSSNSSSNNNTNSAANINSSSSNNNHSNN